MATLALGALPVMAQIQSPNTVWGKVPVGYNTAASASLQAGSAVITQTSAVGGVFRFQDVAPGDYVVVLKDASGNVLAISRLVVLASGGIEEAIFDDHKPAAAVPLATHSYTGVIVLAATGVVGITTGIILATRSGSR